MIIAVLALFLINAAHHVENTASSNVEASTSLSGANASAAKATLSAARANMTDAQKVQVAVKALQTKMGAQAKSDATTMGGVATDAVSVSKSSVIKSAAQHSANADASSVHPVATAHGR